MRRRRERQGPTCEEAAVPHLVTKEVWEDTGECGSSRDLPMGTRDDWLELHGACIGSFVETYCRDPLAATMLSGGVANRV